MKCQILLFVLLFFFVCFFLNGKKNYQNINLLSAELAQRVVKVRWPFNISQNKNFLQLGNL